MTDELEIIRTRHEEAEKIYAPIGKRAASHTDRATLLRAVDRLSAELAKERERREEWQPIETAPRDGQDILVYCQDSSEMFVGFSNPDEIAADPGIFFYALRTDGGRIGCRPHLWRPLPTPPATTQHEDTP